MAHLKYILLWRGRMFLIRGSTGGRDGNRNAAAGRCHKSHRVVRGDLNSGCIPDEAFAEAAKCTEDTPGAKLVLYDDTTRQMLALDPHDKAVGHLGDSVTLRGTLNGNAIRVTSLELLTAIGFAVGQKAPPFSLRDQFGQNNPGEAERAARHGPAFFCSADW